MVSVDFIRIDVQFNEWQYKCDVLVASGVATSVVLFYAGQAGVDLFYPNDEIVRDARGRLHRKSPTDDAGGLLLLRAWAFAFVVSELP